MSKNITIKEGGTVKQLTADKLKTNLLGGGTCQWIPEDAVPLGVKNITEDGTYNASDDGYYGYSQVAVHGIGRATGTDGDGDEATTTTDGDGDLVTTKIPSSIAVTTSPTKTSYTAGETIDFSGIVVTAYLKTGGVFNHSGYPNGVVPVSELVFPVTEMPSDSSRKEWETPSGDFTLHGVTLHGPVTIRGITRVYTHNVKWDEHNNGGGALVTDVRANYFASSSNKFQCLAVNPADEREIRIAVLSDGAILFAAEGNSSSIVYDYDVEPRVAADGYTYSSAGTFRSGASDRTYIYGGKTVHYSIREISEGFSPVISASNNAQSVAPQLAWYMIYGNDGSGGGLTPKGHDIPVEWQRFDDGKILVASFYATLR